MPEYALALALVLVVSLGAISSLQAEAESNLVAHGATAGAPDLPDAGIPATTSTTTGGPATTPTTAALPIVVATGSFDSSSLGLGTNNWSPTVDVSARDSSNQTLTGVTITVTWTENPSGDTTTQSCNVPSTGVCSFQLTNLSRKASNPNFVDTVLVTVDSIIGTNPIIVYPPGSATLTLDAPNT